MQNVFVRELFAKAVAAADPGQAIRQQLTLVDNVLRIGAWSCDLAPIKRIIVIGAGKASSRMAAAVEDVLGDRISGGIVVTKYDHRESLFKIQQHEAAHPIPDAAGEAGVALIEAALQALGTDVLVIACWSGGASALLPAPRAGLTLADKQAVTRALLASGADITAINAVRKHCSRLKGGQLARLCAPAQVLCLVVSDVVGDDLATIGSGPFVADPTTFADVAAYLNQFAIEVPPTVAALVADGVAGRADETPKAGDTCFDRVHHHIVASNSLAVEAVANAAREQGYYVIPWHQPLVGEARSAGASFAAGALQALDRKQRVVLVAGGETTVTLGSHPGKGGRNQEFALAAAGMLSATRWRGGVAPITILAAGTDGTDGPTDAAGAIVDGSTMARGREAGFDLEAHLNQHNAYPYFAQLGALLITGATGTNVMDIDIAVIEP